MRRDEELLDIKMASIEASTKGDSGPNSITYRLLSNRTSKIGKISYINHVSEPIFQLTESSHNQIEVPMLGGQVTPDEVDPTQAYLDYFQNKRR